MIEHAEQELRQAGYFGKGSDYGGLIGHAVMELIKVFDKQNHSGHSADTVLWLFNKLANFESITTNKEK